MHPVIAQSCADYMLNEGFLELFLSWPVAFAKSLSWTNSKLEVSYNNVVDMYLGKRSG